MVDFKAMGLTSDEFKSAGLHENQAVETLKRGNHLGICLTSWENHETLDDVCRIFLRTRVKTV